MSAKQRIKLIISEGNDEDEEGGDGDVAYLSFDENGSRVVGSVKNTIRLADLIKDYNGADLYFDFDENYRLLGVEIIL